MNALNEQAHWFGPSENLFGIVTLPPEGTPVRGPGVVMMNPGTLHRVGGARLNVRIARQLAASGFPSIRFDLSGLGDSEPRHDVRPYLESMSADVGHAVDHLVSQTGLVHFAIVGLCAGAAVSYTAALSDARFVALVQLEGFAYATRLYKPFQIGRRLLDGKKWQKVLRGEKSLRPMIARILSKLTTGKNQADRAPIRKIQSLEEARGAERDLVNLIPPQSKMRDGLGLLVARNVRMLNVFAGKDHPYYSYKGQFVDAFPGLDFKGLLAVERIAGADHLFSAPEHQTWLIDRIHATIEGTARAINGRNAPSD